MLKMVDGTGIIGVDMVCPLGGAVSPPQPPNFDKVEMEGVGSLMLPNSLKAPLERLELIGNSMQGENPAPDNPQEIKSAGRFDEASGKYLLDVKVTGKNLLNLQKQPDVKKTYLGWKVSNGEKIALSVKDKGNNADITGCYLGLSRTGGSADGVVWVVKNGSVAVKEIVSTNQYVSVHPPNETAVQKLLNRFDIQVEYGGNATAYEPYQEPQTLTLTSDRPITKWDKLVEQGGEYGIMYNSKHMLLNGSEDWVKSSINNVFYLKSFEGLPNSYEIFCDKLKNFRGAVNAIELNCILGNRTNLYICIDGITDIGTLKTWLSENNLEVYYNSKESQFVPLPESEQTQLRNLHSYNGTTHINIDSGEVPCGIKLTYRKEN